ncbi:MAG: hypothetical protein ACMXYM_05070 [Candidatus Woesearchaeota archaeon]
MQSLEQTVEKSFVSFGTRVDTYTQGSFALYNSGKPFNNGNLTIRDMPASGVQLHINEGPGGTTHLKTYDQQRIPIDGYRGAMLDYFLDQNGNKKY